MRLAFRVVKLTALDFFEEIFLLVLFNFILVLSAVLVLPLPLAVAGMAWVAAEICEGKAIKMRTFFEGARRYWKPAYWWGGINLIVWGLFLVNFDFYADLDATWATFASLLVLSAAILWGGAQFYVFPFLIRQEFPSLRLAYRNGVVLMAKRPALAIMLFILVVALFAISFRLVMPLIALYFAFVALLADHAVAEALKNLETKDVS